MLRIRSFCFALLLSLIPIAAIAVPTWKSIGPFGGYVVDIAVHPLNPSVVYAISYRGGVFKSVDAGESWHECNNGLIPHRAVAIALDPADINIAYVGLYTDGVFKTLDGGASWSRSSNGLPTDILQIVVADPASSSVLFAGYRSGGIYRTTNSGASWSQAFAGPPESDRMTALKVAPSDSNVLYVSYTGGLFRSTDGGTTWLQVTGAPGGIGSLAIDPRDSNRLLFAVSWGILLTLDGGSTWERTNTELTFDVEIHPANPNLVFCDHAISTDGGLTWTETVPTYPCFPNRISLDPSNPAIILENAGEDFYGKGICKSTDGGVTWTQSNKGLNNTVVIHFALDPYNRGRIFAHAGQGNGLFYSKNAGSTWRDTGILGNFYGSAVLVHPTIPNLVYAGGARMGDPSNSIWRSTNAGATFSSISTDVQGYWTLITDPIDAQTMYCPTYEGVSKSTDGGFHWTPTQGINYSAYEVVADPLVQGLLYASTASEGVMKSTDG
ncbi:MAG TPA: hypothetical protein VLR94_05175, partial [Acidobacteriota bacterium]|nr:hypothetical protein [Acidobacteriota bacterium]